MTQPREAALEADLLGNPRTLCASTHILLLAQPPQQPTNLKTIIKNIETRSF